MMAFRGDAKVKADLLERLAESAPLPRVTLATDHRLIALAEELDLPAAAALLCAHLAEEDGAPSAGFANEVVSAIQPGVDLHPVAHLWTVWVWEGIDESLRTLVDSATLREACDAVIDMHRQEAGGHAVSRGQWRAARAALGSAGVGDDTATAAAAAVGASAWDYRTTPLAMIDVLTGWRRARAEWVHSAMGWHNEDTLRLQRLILDQREAAEARAASAGETAGTDAYRRRLTEEIQLLIAEVDEPLVRRNAEVRRRSSQSFAELRRRGRQELLSLIRRSCTRSPGTAG